MARYICIALLTQFECNWNNGENFFLLVSAFLLNTSFDLSVLNTTPKAKWKSGSLQKTVVVLILQARCIYILHTTASSASVKVKISILIIKILARSIKVDQWLSPVERPVTSSCFLQIGKNWKNSVLCCTCIIYFYIPASFVLRHERRSTKWQSKVSCLYLQYFAPQVSLRLVPSH